MTSTPSPLQLWLSSRPTRSIDFDKPVVHGLGSASEISFDGHLTYEVHKMNNLMTQGGIKSTSGPARHIHLNETEYFKILTGKMGAELNGKRVLLTAEDEEFKIPPGLPHRFWREESEEDLKIRVRVEGASGDNRGFGEEFMRNLVGYLTDCEDAKMKPSPFQLMLFLYSHDIVLSLPLPLFLIKILHHVGGYWIGQGLLGYQPSYPEYYQQKKDL